MDKAKKAALLSALLFPGWGQIYLKHYQRGLVFIVSITAGMISLALSIILSGLAVIKAAPFKKGTIQFADVIRVLMSAFEGIDMNIFLLMSVLLIILWILSIIDAYRLGKKTVAAATTVSDPGSLSDPS